MVLPDLITVILGVFLVVIFLWNNLFKGAVNFTPTVGTNDYMDMNIPYRKFYNDTILKGKIPLWSSEISSGYPIMASSEIGSLNPLNLLTVRFDPLTSYAISLAISYFMIFIFTYLYLRQLKLSPEIALLGGVITSYSGYAANQIMHLGWLNAYAYFIGELFLIEKHVRTNKFIYVLLNGLLLGLSALGGHPQIIIYSQLIIYPYWLFRWWLRGQSVSDNKKQITSTKNSLKKPILYFIFSLLVYTIIGLGIGAAQLLPTYEFTQNSTRSGGLNEASVSYYSFELKDLYTFIKPFAFYSGEHNINGFSTNGWPTDEKYIYTGIIPIILALMALVFARKNIFTWIFTAVFVFSWLFALGNKTVFVALLRLPPVSFFRIPYRISFLMSLSIAGLSVLGMQALLKQKIFAKFKPVIKRFFLIALVILVFFDLRIHAKKLYPEVDGRSWYQTPQSVPYLKENLANQERVTEEAYFDMSFPYFVNNPTLWDDPQVHKNLRNALPIFLNLLYDIPKNTPAANSGGLKISRYNELESTIFFDGFEYKEDGSIGVTDSYLFLNRIMGVKYILSNKLFQSYVTSPVKKIDFGEGQAPVYIYEFFDYFPRQFMVPHAEKAEPEIIKKHLMDVDFEPLQKIYVEKDVDWGAKGGYSADSHFEKYEDTEVVVKTEASGDGFLFLSDTYYPGWRAFVDGKETEILRANYAFRAVKVPQGVHEVVFKYQPDSLMWGIRISIAALTICFLGILISLLFKIKNHRKKEK